MLIKEIAEKEDIDIVMVRNMFRTLEHILFIHLSSTSPDANTVVKVLKGLSIECNYIPERTIQRYETITCKPRIWARPKLTRYFNRKLNPE